MLSRDRKGVWFGLRGTGTESRYAPLAAAFGRLRRRPLWPGGHRRLIPAAPVVRSAFLLDTSRQMET